MNVAPWDLMEQPLYWIDWALQSRTAEIEVENENNKREQDRLKAKSRT